MDQRKNVSAKPEACRVRSTARTAEGRDYAYYFCADCGQRWPQEKHNSRHVNRSE